MRKTSFPVTGTPSKGRSTFFKVVISMSVAVCLASHTLPVSLTCAGFRTCTTRPNPNPNLKKPYPSSGVRVFERMGMGSPQKTRGLPRPITSHSAATLQRRNAPKRPLHTKQRHSRLIPRPRITHTCTQHCICASQAPLYGSVYAGV